MRLFRLLALHISTAIVREPHPLRVPSNTTFTRVFSSKIKIQFGGENLTTCLIAPPPSRGKEKRTRKRSKMNDREEKKPFVRLPTDVVPTNYAVQLTPDLEKFTFNGILDIDVKVSEKMTNYQLE